MDKSSLRPDFELINVRNQAGLKALLDEMVARAPEPRSHHEYALEYIHATHHTLTTLDNRLKDYSEGVADGSIQNMSPFQNITFGVALAQAQALMSIAQSLAALGCPEEGLILSEDSTLIIEEATQADGPGGITDHSDMD
jgi:hypothetical protein